MVPIELAYIVLGIAYKNKPVNTKQAHTLGINLRFWDNPSLPKITKCLASTPHSNCHIYSLFVPPWLELHHFITRKLLQSMQRTLPNKDSRLPNTYKLLHTIIPTLQTVCNTIFKAKLLSAASILTFHALVRISEITVLRKHNRKCY